MTSSRTRPAARRARSRPGPQPRKGRAPIALEAILLDIDGTLFLSNDPHARAWREVMREQRGLLVPLSRIRPLIGMGGAELAGKLLGGRASRRDLEALADVHEELFRSEYLPSVREVPGAADFLRECRRRGVRVVLASSGKPEQVRELARKLGVTRYIEGATDADDVARAKPAPDLFLAGMRKFRLPNATAVVGDTPYDVRAARAAGLPAIGVLTGGFSRASLAGAARVYGRVGDILEDLVWCVR
ncbi:MAG: HAD family hydrolase [Gemmatimonadetes bacterium]|nr:HAD family hydrolase [Gemmatimonadota bacterium]